MTVIEADGVNTQSLTVDSIQIFAGQRYSFVVRHRYSYSLHPSIQMADPVNSCKPTSQWRIIGSEPCPITVWTPASTVA